MANKRFDADMADITVLAVKLLGVKADGTVGNYVIPFTFDGTNFGFGTSSPAVRFHIKVGTNINLGFRNGEIDPAAMQLNAFNDAASLNIPIEFKASKFNFALGNLGVNTNSPTEKLQVTGNILASGTITPASDKRVKKNIKTLTSSLEKILLLRPVSYQSKDDGKGALGFVADEVKSIFPDLVLVGKDEDKLLSLNYMGMSAPIVGAIQELSAAHSELQDKYNELLARIEKLEG